MRGREAIEGHDTIALCSRRVRRCNRGRTEGRQMQKFSLRAWISESDHELVRLDAEAIDTLSMGFGVLARLHKGSQLLFLAAQSEQRGVAAGSRHIPAARTRRPCPDTPAQRHIGVLGYRKFSVDTATTYQPPKK